MALPAGFKVNGLSGGSGAVKIPAPVQKVLAFLDELPYKELMDTRELWVKTGVNPARSPFYLPIVDSYRQKVDNKNVWGSPKTIAELRRQLNEPEETNDEN